MDCKTIINSSITELKKHNIKFPHLDAEILLSFVLKKPREFLLTYPEFQLTKAQLNSFNKLISRRIKGEPVAYLTGKKGFYGLEFLVNKDVLVPRPETELMIEEALKTIKTKQTKLILIDVGTGCGCIIITLARLISNQQQIAGYKLYGLDVSKKALSVAKQNVKFNRIKEKIHFLQGNLLEPILKKSKFSINKNSEILILANLPYGWSAWKNNSSADTIGLKFEPKIALFTGKNGLELYEKLLIQLKTIEETNTDITAFLEIDPRQMVGIKKMIKKLLPNANIEIKKDLKGHSRLAKVSLFKL